MAKVYVVMGNDFPSSVWSTEALAEKEVERQKRDDFRNNTNRYPSPRIHWRVNEFVLDREGN
jgi:hypothetical protein